MASARYSGYLGIVEEQEVSPGVWEEAVREVAVLGDLLQRTETLAVAGEILPRISTTMSVKVHARGLGQVRYSNIRYVTYAGKRWGVTSEVTSYPWLVIYLGEEYHGPTPE